MKNLNHLAVIMDGNSRWASSRNLPSKEGHKEGVKKARLAVEYALEKKIDYLTLFAFSTENWLREELEVKDLINLFFQALEEQTPELIEEKVKLNFIGDISRFSKKLINQIERSKKQTRDYRPDLNLIIAASYGGKWDIINAVTEFFKENKTDVQKNKITEASVQKHLQTNNFPDPDLIIRSGGEKRLSNFYLWQSSYSELYFSNKYWPDFTKNDLDKALDDYFNRKRKYGVDTG